MKAAITVDTGRVVARPNPSMWGIFYEEINHAGDGGLYAEQLLNRNFAAGCLPEETVYSGGKVLTKEGHEEAFSIEDPLPGWSVKPGYASEALISRTVDDPRNPECPYQMKLTLWDKGYGARIVNSGYWGFSACPEGYHGMIIVKSAEIASLRVGLMRSNGAAVTSAEITGIGPAYRKFEFTLEGAAHTDLRFFIEVSGNGAVCFDYVSLFPNNTYLNRKYGFRKDLVEALQGLKPGFVRFPGGCVVEGINLQNAIHWKKTLGPAEDRPGHWDLWSYRCTDGLGMHEFLQLCEDLDAEAMYVCNCGMSCQGRKPELASPEEVRRWLADALDAIEYMIGGTDTVWGAKRAENGHPAPFQLRYVEIGNENWGPEYAGRYRLFYDAIHERYPQLELIADCRVEDAPLDIVDDHYYTPPQVMPQIWDKYERSGGSGEKIYVGEYACNQEVGYGNLLSAVSEACFMIGMERGADVVRIASYAPLFCNENDRKWPVNLINFNKDQVYALPSYYVQQLFSKLNPQEVFQTGTENVIGDSRLYASAGRLGKELIVKVACFGVEAVTAELSVRGAALGGEATVLLLSGDDPAATNSALCPFEITPSELTIPVDGGSGLTYTFPACSLTVLRIPLANAD